MVENMYKTTTMSTTTTKWWKYLTRGEIEKKKNYWGQEHSHIYFFWQINKKEIQMYVIRAKKIFTSHSHACAVMWCAPLSQEHVWNVNLAETFFLVFKLFCLYNFISFYFFLFSQFNSTHDAYHRSDTLWKLIEN